MSLRKRQRRENDIARDFVESVKLSTDESILAGKSNDDLFVIDRMGSKNAKKKIEKQEVALQEGRISTTESRLIAQIISGKVKALTKKLNYNQNKSELQDLWGNEPFLTNPRHSKPATKKLKVAGPGQSYNPSLDHHQDTLAEALALQILKDENDARATGSLVISSSSVIESSRDYDSSDDESRDGVSDQRQMSIEGHIGDDINGPNTVSTRKLKKNAKLTRAQRNKLKARKENKFHEVLQKQENQLLKSLDNIPNIVKEIASIESQQEINAMIKAARQQADKAGSMTYEEAGTVPLTDELRGSLRCLRPKGSNLNDQVSRMRATGDLMDGNRRRRTRFEKPHGSKRIKWVAKYKYT